jgi:hypothetical protein
MKRFFVITFLISLFSLALIPVSAKPNTPQQSELPIPQGFCVQFSIPIGDLGIVYAIGGNSIGLIPLYVELLVEDGVEGDIYRVTGWIFTDEAYEIYSVDSYEFISAGFEALTGFSLTNGGGDIRILSRNACSFKAYQDNAALAQTYLVPDTGYDVYQIFDGAGILSFRVTQDDLAGASAGEVLGSNDAGNISFTYNGGGTCTVVYPYPDGKIGSSTFVCQGEITDWGRVLKTLEFSIIIIP